MGMEVSKRRNQDRARNSYSGPTSTSENVGEQKKRRGRLCSGRGYHMNSDRKPGIFLSPHQKAGEKEKGGILGSGACTRIRITGVPPPVECSGAWIWTMVDPP